jgi:Invasion associated locus B (IalB) protein
MRRITRTILTFAIAALSMHAAEAQTRNIKKFGEWRVMAHETADTRICFAMASPRISDPPDPSGGAFFYISAWPKEGVRAEISVKTSANLKPGAPASIQLDQTFYKLFSKGDRAFVIDATDELKLLEAMKKGSTVTVLAQNEQGVISKDTYSLSGIAQAVQAISSGCK